MRALFILLFINLLISSQLLSQPLIIDLSDLSYSDASNWISVNTDMEISGVIAGGPFKTYNGNLPAGNSPVYDFFDIGGKFQRGSAATFWGSESDFSGFAKSLSADRISLYAYLDLFTQAYGYSPDQWDPDDFIAQASVNPERLYIDISNSKTREKLSKIISYIKSLPVKKWVADIRKYPRDLEKDYADYLQSNFGNSVIILSDDGTEAQASSKAWMDLRTNVFTPENIIISNAANLRIDKNQIQYIDSPELTIYNIASVAYLFSRNCHLIIGHAFLSDYNKSLIKFCESMGDFSTAEPENGKLILYNSTDILAMNFTINMASWNEKLNINKTGFFKSLQGGSMLTINGPDASFFMLPGTISFWNIQ